MGAAEGPGAEGRSRAKTPNRDVRVDPAGRGAASPTAASSPSRNGLKGHVAIDGSYVFLCMSCPVLACSCRFISQPPLSMREIGVSLVRVTVYRGCCDVACACLAFQK